ncbi:hypothetical protein [Polluticoccus soli]|uniref:hypothetical protein n=1 Tax=Polluticoccus soli TaxID=3034150 RepID=UPI0023E1A5DD|nr:hypothetical protein [Flavipsychrobacter sp. JY13-12]
MEIISHRGYWKTTEEKNSVAAFERSFSLGFGTETDVRDYRGELVISHDIATADCISLVDFMNIYQQSGCKGRLALNIKADGLQKDLLRILNSYAGTSHFVFDMSVPDTIGYLTNSIPVFSRHSEYEPHPPFYEKCHGVWLDAFVDTWYSTDVIKAHIESGKEVAIVSPELHKREHAGLWELLKQNNIANLDGVILCTDLPEEAQQFFFA